MHTDDIAIDRFAEAMKDKMAKNRDKGKHGWDDPDDCTVELLSHLLIEHVAKRQPLDVAILAMMLHQRGSMIVIDPARPYGWPYGSCELTPDAPCNPFNCCDMCSVPGAGKHEASTDRKTFTVPDGYEPVLDADGRCTGEIRKVDPPALVEGADCADCAGTGFKDKNGARMMLARTPCSTCNGTGRAARPTLTEIQEARQ